MKRRMNTRQREAMATYRDRTYGDPPSGPSSLLGSLAARIWDDVTGGAGVVLQGGTEVKPAINAHEVKAAEELHFRSVQSAETARLRRIARLKKEADEVKKNGGAR